MTKSIFVQHLINNAIVRRLLFQDEKKKRSRLYLDRFRECRQSKIERNIFVQLLPVFLVLTLLYLLSSQNLFFGTVLSGSMEPNFKRGDLVLMRSSNGVPQPGDIIMFVPKEGMEPVTHRVASVDEFGYVRTKGDANINEDDWILSKQNIAARAITIGGAPIVIPRLGSILVSRADNFSVNVKKNKGLRPIFDEIRTLTPLMIFFMLILYMFIFFENRSDENIRFGSGKRKIK